MPVAQGTTLLCPRSSMRRDTRGETRKTARAHTDETIPALRAEWPMSVSIETLPMVIMQVKMRMRAAPRSKRQACRTAKTGL